MTRAFLFATLVVAAGLSGGCLTAPRNGPVGVEALVYETGDAFLCSPCEGLKVTLTPDGQMWVEQRRSRAGRRLALKRTQARLPTDQARQVWELLEPYRPAAGAPRFSPACEELIPDQGAVHVTWRSADGASKTIVYNACDPEAHRELRSRLNRVPGLLGLKGGPYV
jgi:hypothetical protein